MPDVYAIINEVDAVTIARVAEARRVLRPGGRAGIFDDDYATITSLAGGDDDPLQCCVSAFRQAYITDVWVMRRLPALVAAAGLVATRPRSHGFVQIDHPDYMLSIADRGADALVATGRIGTELGGALNVRRAGGLNRMPSSVTSPT